METAFVNSPKANLEEPRLVLRRVVIEGLQPEIDAGKYPIKRTVGERVVVEADIHADGQDVLSAVVLYRPERESAWREAAMRPLSESIQLTGRVKFPPENRRRVWNRILGFLG